jgi:glycosyltransferase involved in cell wall biosynthesis
MRLLVVTQVVDRNDTFLGFFHRWLEEFASRYEHVHVICLKEGGHALPSNVTVHSLGKEDSVSRMTYVVRLFRFVWGLRREYDAVFVHMNQEYVLLAGWLWKLMGKRIYLWRNHYAGGFFTDIAAMFATKVFCTSKHSYTMKYAKTVVMPVGIDTSVFKPKGERVPHSILSLGRIAPSKNIEVILQALKTLNNQGADFTATICGDALPQDSEYHESLRRFVAEEGLAKRVRFIPGIPNTETPAIFSAHQVFVNASTSGMFDKTIFEAAACGSLSVA